MNVSRERIFVTCPVLIHADTGILDANTIMIKQLKHLVPDSSQDNHHMLKRLSFRQFLDILLKTSGVLILHHHGTRN